MSFIDNQVAAYNERQNCWIPSSIEKWVADKITECAKKDIESAIGRGKTSVKCKFLENENGPASTRDMHELEEDFLSGMTGISSLTKLVGSGFLTSAEAELCAAIRNNEGKIDLNKIESMVCAGIAELGAKKVSVRIERREKYLGTTPGFLRDKKKWLPLINKYKICYVVSW